MTLQIYMYRYQVKHIYVMTIVSYMLMKYLKRDQQHKYVMAFAMAYLSGQHIHQMLSDFGGWRLGIKSYTMILVTKVWALAWAYRDGGEEKTTLS